MKQSTVNRVPAGVDKLVATAKEYVWPAFGRDATFFGFPLSIIRTGEGNYVIDSFGNRLLETNSCGAAASLGFNHPALMAAMKQQMEKIVVTTPNLFAPTEPVVWLSEKLAQISPGNLKYTIYSSNGSDANETALKIARHYWKIMGKGTKYKIIHRYPGDYHGMSMSVSSASGHIFRRVPFEPLMAGFVAIHTPNCYRCPYNQTHPECNLLCAEELRKVIEFEDPSTIACFITESTNTGLGIIPPPPGYMKRVREICDQYEILLICDEVITGFARSGFWFECEKHGIVPDMLALGKNLAWGYGPLAGTHVRSEIAEAFTGKDTLQHGYTFGGTGYLAAAGLAGIEYVEGNNLLARAKEIGDIMSRELGAIQKKSAVVGDVRANAGLIAVELVKDRATKELFPDRAAVAGVINKVGRENGVLFNCSTWYGDILWMMVSLTMSNDELGMIVGALDKAVAAVEKQFT
jgi:adenosylmethionine-8-amino-7-oxononanoate aminotransferase